MVRLQDKLMSVDLFSAELRLIGASQSSRQISAKQSANEAGEASQRLWQEKSIMELPADQG